MPAHSLSRMLTHFHTHQLIFMGLPTRFHACRLIFDRTSHIGFYFLRIMHSQVASTNVDEPQPSRMLISLALAFVFHSNPIPACISPL